MIRHGVKTDLIYFLNENFELLIEHGPFKASTELNAALGTKDKKMRRYINRKIMIKSPLLGISVYLVKLPGAIAAIGGRRLPVAFNVEDISTGIVTPFASGISSFDPLLLSLTTE
jgi:hypothetical protein